MADDAVWNELREQCERLEPGSELVTPLSERRFEIGATDGERIDVRFQDSGEPRSLERRQFDVLADRLSECPLPLSTLTPGIEPYAAVMTLAPRYSVDDEEIAHAPEGAVDGESPYLLSPAAARTQPERIHDDALLLVDLLGRVGEEGRLEFDTLETDTLTDLYVLLSDTQRGADRLRRSAGAELLERLGPDQTLQGRFGAVHRTTRRYHRLKDGETVLDALDERGIPREWVLGIDSEKLDVVLATTELDEADVYDIDERTYAQKTGVDEDEKFSRLQGLAERIDDLEGEAGEELRDDLEQLEHRLEEALSAD